MRHCVRPSCNLPSVAERSAIRPGVRASGRPGVGRPEPITAAWWAPDSSQAVGDCAVTEHAADRHVIRRRWSYAPPPWRMFEAVTDEIDRWFPLLIGETGPKLHRATRPSSVVFRPWIDQMIYEVTVESAPRAAVVRG